MTLLFRNARVLTLAGGVQPRRGAALAELGVRPAADVLVSEGRIAAIDLKIEPPADTEVIDANGRVLMPGFVDCHTRACWAGDRLDEWEKRLRGTGASGGDAAANGIVQAVRAATRKQLAANLRARLDLMLRAGTTTVEVKSGYGLTLEAELKLLHAIARAANEWPGTVVPTALLGRAIEGDPAEYTRLVVREFLPQVWHEFPGITIEARCDRDAWPVEACVRLLERARKHGLPIRVQADHLASLGMVPEALRLHARSVDHLEATTDADLAQLGAAADTFAVLLPATGFHTDRRYARGRRLVELGAAVALATNCNPETAPTHALPFAIALAVRYARLTPAEAITACTVNAASLLGLRDRGTIEVGQRADLLLLRHRDERALAYEVGDNPLDVVVCGGRLVDGSRRS